VPVRAGRHRGRSGTRYVRGVTNRSRRRQCGAGEHDEWLAEVARGASHEVGDVPVELLGEYLPLLAEAAISGRAPEAAELDAVARLGRRAAELGVSAGSVVQLYLSAARLLWQQLPEVVRSTDSEAVRSAAAAVLHVVDEAVARLVVAHTDARRQLVRWEETLRREFIDDLLRGDADVGRLMERAEPFGLDMGRPHQVALAAPADGLGESEETISALERAVVQWAGDRDVLVATKDGRLIAITPADSDVPGSGRESGPASLGELLLAELEHAPGRPWRITVGRPYPGSYGIARSYEEAREGLAMAERLGLEAQLVAPEQLLIYRVLLRDQPAITDLVQSVLGKLVHARGGAEPLLQTLDAYFASGGITTEAARRLHLSVRAVTYRLGRIRELTGYDPTDPAQRFTVHAAVLGARLLGWPERGR